MCGCSDCLVPSLIDDHLRDRCPKRHAKREFYWKRRCHVDWTDEGLESRDARAHLVATGRDAIERELAAAVGGGRADRGAERIGQVDGRAGHGKAGLVQDGAADESKLQLCGGGGGQEAENECGEQAAQRKAHGYFTSTISMASLLGPSIITARRAPTVYGCSRKVTFSAFNLAIHASRSLTLTAK